MEQKGQEVLRLDRTGLIPDGVDVVYDCAAYGNLSSQRTDAKEIYKANLWRVLTEMEDLDDNQKYIYISSSSVTRPKQNLYSLSKKAAEEYLRLQQKQVAIVRPFSIYGPGQQEEHLIPTLIRSCLYGAEMPFVGEPTHDWISVDDMVNALLVVAKYGEFNGEIYEVGSGVATTNEEIKNIVESVTGKKANIHRINVMRDYDGPDWRANNEKICSLGWSPNDNIVNVIRSMVLLINDKGM